MKILIITLALIGSLLLVLAATYCYAFWKFGETLENMKVTDQDRAKWTAFYEMVNQLNRTIPSSSAHTTVDYSGFGLSDREQDLRNLRTAIHFFNVKSGHLPGSINEIAKYESATTISLKKLAQLEHWARDCRFVRLQFKSYLVTCDDWSDMAPRDFEKLAESFDPAKERYYLVDDRLLLFVPNK